MKKGQPVRYQQPVNPIKPVGLSPHIVESYPMTRYLDYTERDWRFAVDSIVNNGMGMNWGTMVTWALSQSTFLRSLINRRIDPLLEHNYVVKDQADNVVERFSDVLDSQWFKEIVKSIGLSIFYGYTAGGFDPKTKNVFRYPIELIDPFNESLKENPYRTEGDTRFNDYSDLFFVKYFDERQTMLGLLEPLIYDYIGMAMARRNWLASGARYAFPMLMVGYNGDATEFENYTDENGEVQQREVNRNKETAIHIARNLDPTVGLASPFHLNENGIPVYDVDVKQTEMTAKERGFETYKSFIDDTEQRMMNLVLGASLTMDEGHSRSLGEVHERVTDSIHEKDLKMVVETLNDVFLPKLNIPDGMRFDVEDVSSITLDDAVKISTVAAQNGQKLTVDFFDAIGVPDNFLQDVPTVKIESEAKEQPEKNFFKRLFAKHSTPAQSSEVILKAPDLEDVVSDEEVTLPVSKTAHISDRRAKEIYDQPAGAPIAIDYAQYKYYQDIFSAPLKGDNPLAKLSVTDFNIINMKYLANIAQFSAAKDAAEQAAFKSALLDDRGRRVSFEEFKERVSQISKVFREDWLKTEYRTAGATAIMAKEWEDVERDKLQKPAWQYKTQEDDKVRPAHQRLDNLVFRVDDADGQKLFPPNGWNCRCWFRQLSEEEMRAEGLSYANPVDVSRMIKEDVEKGFAFNPSVNGIMPNSDSSYFDVVPSMNKLDYRSFGLEQTSVMMRESPDDDISIEVTVALINSILARTKNKKTGKNEIKNKQTGMTFEVSDQLARNVEMRGGDGFNLFTKTVSHPDEVWASWDNDMNQKSVHGTMLHIAGNVVYAVDFENEKLTDAYVVRSTTQADSLRKGVLFK